MIPVACLLIPLLAGEIPACCASLCSRSSKHLAPVFALCISSSDSAPYRDSVSTLHCSCDPSMSSRSKRDRDRSPSDSERKHKKRHSLTLPYNAAEIEEHDFFLKSSPFRVWLLEEKGKSFDSVSGEKAREYFDKFIRRWNKGKLDGTVSYKALRLF